MTNHPATTFIDLGVSAELADALGGAGITSPFPIQAATLPDSLAGRDVLGRGRTGSGKTMAFALPVITRLAAAGTRSRTTRPRALVLVPTRELATQVQTAMKPLAAATGLSTMTIFGGVGQGPQIATLARGVDIVIACPGRLEDLMRQGKVHLDDVQVSVLDEADHMADLGFLPGVRRILDATPKGGQRLLFSATLDNGVDVLVRRFLTNPVTHSVDDDATTVPDMTHHVLTVVASEKGAVVHELASGRDRSVLFTRTKHGARKLARDLTKAGIPAVDLHGNLSQNARDRNLAQFRDGEVRVLVATDVAARGIHVDDIALVVHVDPPSEHKAYLHRSGRTARAGATGVVVTLQTSEQRRDVAAMTRQAGITPTMTVVSPGATMLQELTGPRAAHVEPAAVSTPPATVDRTTKAGSSSRRRPKRSRSTSTSSSQGPSASTHSSSRPATRTSGRAMTAADFSARSGRGRSR